MTYHVHPEHTQRTEREDAHIIAVDEDQADDQQHDLRHVRREEVQNEALNVGEDAATFADGSTNGVEVTKGGMVST